MIAWFEDLEVTARLLRRWPPSLEDEQEWLKKTAADPNSVFWVIEHEDRAIGTTGIHGIDWTNGNGKTGTLIGDKSMWGKGIAREVMQLRAGFAFRELPLRKSPSISETIDWARTLTVLGVDELDAGVLADTLNIVLKYERDMKRAVEVLPRLVDPNRELPGVGHSRGHGDAHGHGAQAVEQSRLCANRHQS